METMKYTCAQSLISMCTIVGKFEKCLRLSVVGGCHGNQLSVMGVMYYVCVLSFIPIMLPLACYNDKQYYQETLPEAICCC